VTNHSPRSQLGLTEGSEVIAVIKASDVIVATAD
jgi:molybdopterin-binding protein